MDRITRPRKEKTTKNRAGASGAVQLLSVLHTPFKAASIIDTGTTALSNAITGEEAPVDYSSPVYDSSRYQSAVREQVSSDIDSGIGRFLYQTGLSMGDFLTLMPLAAAPGGQVAATAILGGSAASDTAMDVSERGGTSSQAFWGGLAAGVAEAVFEKFSLESILKPGGVTGIKTFAKELLKGAGVEASEEAATEIANIISDQVIMGGKSNYSILVKQYTENGISRDEAEKKALLDMAKQVGTAAAGGALSGGITHAFKGAAELAYNKKTASADVQGSVENFNSEYANEHPVPVGTITGNGTEATAEEYINAFENSISDTAEDLEALVRVVKIKEKASPSLKTEAELTPRNVSLPESARWNQTIGSGTMPIHLQI